MTPLITIEVKYGRMTVHYEKLPKAKLVFQAAGLDIFVKGSSSEIHDDALPNLAMQECLSRHIPLISLRRVTK